MTLKLDFLKFVLSVVDENVRYFYENKYFRFNDICPEVPT